MKDVRDERGVSSVPHTYIGCALGGVPSTNQQSKAIDALPSDQQGRPTAPMTTREAGFQHDSSIQPEDLPLRHGIRCWNLARGTSRRVKFCESKKSRGSNSLRCLDGIWDHFGSFKGGLMFHRLWMIWDGCEHLEGGI